jgi:hypothetical protein
LIAVKSLCARTEGNAMSFFLNALQQNGPA